MKSPNVVVSVKEVTSEQQFRKNCQTAATDLALLHGTSIDKHKVVIWGAYVLVELGKLTNVI